MITHGVNIGVIGRHVYAIEDPSKIPEGLKMVYISFVIIILGCVFAKTSFAITLLRIVTEPWMKVTLWFIIVSMNALMWTTAVSYLAQCSPSAALWRTELLATAKCWPSIVFEVIGMTAGGKLSRILDQEGQGKKHPTDNSINSLLWTHGFCPLYLSLGDSMEPANEQAGEVRYCSRNEHGYIVGPSQSFAMIHC